MSIQPPDPQDALNVLSPGSAMNRRRMSRSTRDNLYGPGRMEVAYGIPPAHMGDANAIIDTSLISSGFEAVPVAASTSEYFEAIPIFEHESDEYLDPDDAHLYTDMQGKRLSRSTVRALPSRGYYYDNLSVQAQSPSAPAQLSEIPTSTINPERPRTVAAGYDIQRMVLTVVFRDGTFYNYYLDSLGERTASDVWNKFKRARSKGRFIVAYLDPMPRGVANVSTLSSAGRETLYRLSRTGQIIRKGVTGTQKGGRAPKRYKPPAGYPGTGTKPAALPKSRGRKRP